MERRLSMAEIRKLAQQGVASAQYAFAEKLLKNKKIQEAVFWLSQAAEQKNVAACYELGKRCYHGQGISVDYKRAFNLFETVIEKAKSADKKTRCYIYLGWMLRDGLGLEKDEQSALKWFEKAADEGNSVAQYEAYFLLLHNSALRHKARTSFLSYLERSARAEFSPAQLDYGLLFYNSGKFEKAFKWIKKSAEQGNPDAQKLIGSMYLSGEGCTRSNKNALFWKEKSAQQGHPDAQADVGLMHYGGIGTTKNISSAYFWSVLAANGLKEMNAPSQEIDEAVSLIRNLKQKLSKEEVSALAEKIKTWVPERTRIYL